MDDQHLFELHVKLQYADDEQALVAALFELSGTVRDFPPEAFLQRSGLLEAAAATLQRTDTSEQAALLALSFLQAFAERVQSALANAADVEQVPQYTDMIFVD